MFKFRNKLVLTEKEQQFENCILKLLAQEKTKKKVNQTVYILSNEEKHILIKVDDKGIILQNTIYSTKEVLNDKVIAHFKNIIDKNINQDIEEDIYIISIGKRQNFWKELINYYR